MPAAIEPSQAVKQRIVNAVRTHLRKRYGLVKWLGNGATAYVLGLSERTLNQPRAIKILRPDVSDVDVGVLQRKFATYFAGEIAHLASITHENVVKVFEKGKIKLPVGDQGTKTVPFYIMEFIDGFSLDEYLEENFSSLKPRHVFNLIVQLGNGLSAIHQRGIIHGDVKPANIRVTKNGELKLTDFGFAKSIYRPGPDGSLWCQDRRYLHPELLARMLQARIKQPEEAGRSLILVTSDEISKRGMIWELHSIGKTIDELIRTIEGAGTRKDFFRNRDREFLTATISRLIDTREYGPWTALPRIDSYTNASELAPDLLKLSAPADLGGDAPELQISYHRSLRIPLASPVPLSERLRAIIDHPLFQRLATVTQLGVVNLVFRSANHTRFEHSLGVLASTIHYLQALWNSPTGSYFRQIVRQADCEAVLLAALLHDLGQYPFAHAFEESEIANRRLYSHADLTRRLLTATSPEDLEVAGDAPLFESDEDRERVRRLLHDANGRLIGEIIGTEWGERTLDDVLYLLKDNSKAGRPALTILRQVVDGPIDADKMDYLRRDALHLGVSGSPDEAEFLRWLTLVPESPRGDRYDLALEEAGVSVAQDVHMARYRMFVNIYWQRVARSAERMLRFAVDGLREHYTDVAFRRIFFSQILTCSDTELVARLRRQAQEAASRCSDDKRSDLEGIAEVLDHIERRRLYHEAFMLDANADSRLHEKLSAFWDHALRNQDANERFRDFVERFLRLVESKVNTPIHPHQLLIDIPDPTTDQPEKYAMWLRREDGTRRSILEASPIWKEFSELFRVHGRKIRIYTERDLIPLLKDVAFAEVLNGALADTDASYFTRRATSQE